MATPRSVPSAIVCFRDTGRSQMAAAFVTHIAGGAVEVRSAGSAPADAVNPAVVEATRETGIDLSAEIPDTHPPARRGRPGVPLSCAPADLRDEGCQE